MNIFILFFAFSSSFIKGDTLIYLKENKILFEKEQKIIKIIPFNNGKIRNIFICGDTLFALSDKDSLFYYKDKLWFSLPFTMNYEDFVIYKNFFIMKKNDKIFIKNRQGDETLTLKFSLSMFSKVKLKDRIIYLFHENFKKWFLYDLFWNKFLASIPEQFIDEDYIFTKNYALSFSPSKNFSVYFFYCIYNTGEDTIFYPRIYFALPQSSYHQEIKSIYFFDKIPNIYFENSGQKIAEISFKKLPPMETLITEIEIKVSISESYFLLHPDSVRFVEREKFKEYLINEEYYDMRNPYIKEIAFSYKEKFKNPLELIIAVMDFISEKVDYELKGEWLPPLSFLKKGKGSCSEYAFLFSSILRLCGIPTRLVGGTVRRDSFKTESYDFNFHRWVEVYLEPYAWVPFDPSAYDVDNNFKKINAIGYIPSYYLVMSIEPGKSKYLEWSYIFNHFPKNKNISKTAFALWKEE